ncbi:MAG: sporulation peptidase YabG [Clostridia bacterium]|nr:sporulation peptidase YabG [Clostridia bacterium]
MTNIKVGDIVSRSSYNNDILFYVESINNNTWIAILKGVTIRIEADSPIDDLALASESRIHQSMDYINEKINYNDVKRLSRYGKILHLDGDRKYSEKTEKYYRKRGLNYVVKYVAEHKQPIIIKSLLAAYRPDILVITGHDGMIKKGKNFNDIENYRNSKYFYKTVAEARSLNPNRNDLVIFAGACQSYYEALISAGANFASSPARILIDFVDPLIVAEKISTTNNNKVVLMSDLEPKIRNGRKAVGGIGAKGKSL